MCLLATSVGPLLYSLQDLPFHLAEYTHSLTRTQTHTSKHGNLRERRLFRCRHKETGRWGLHTPATCILPVFLFSPFLLVPTLICSSPLKTPQTPYGPPENCSPPPPPPTHHPRTCTHANTDTQGEQQKVYCPLLISGCHFSVVYLILSSASVVAPYLPALVRNEGGHLSSMLPLPSSLSSQTTMVASVWLRKGKTLFACVSIGEAVCVGLTAGTPFYFWSKCLAHHN